MGTEVIYPHPSFSDSVPSFGGQNGNPYDIINTLPSSYSSGKVSPLTPNDSVGGMHGSSFPSSVAMNGAKYSPHSSYADLMPDRRIPTVSNGNYQPDFTDEYNGVSNALSFPPTAIQSFQGRFPPDGRFGHSAGPPSTVPSHVHPGHSPDILRGVAPHATHSFRPDGVVPGYDDMHYLGPNPQNDMGLRMPTVDETLARMKLQGHSIMSTSNDLQTFIR